MATAAAQSLSHRFFSLYDPAPGLPYGGPECHASICLGGGLESHSAAHGDAGFARWFVVSSPRVAHLRGGGVQRHSLDACPFYHEPDGQLSIPTSRLVPGAFCFCGASARCFSERAAHYHHFLADRQRGFPRHRQPTASSGWSAIFRYIACPPVPVTVVVAPTRTFATP